MKAIQFARLGVTGLGTAGPGPAGRGMATDPLGEPCVLRADRSPLFYNPMSMDCQITLTVFVIAFVIYAWKTM
jgi:hypothetical protein